MQVTIAGDMSITATFEPEEYTLLVEVVGAGSVDVVPGQTTYSYGDVVTLAAEADPDWTFAGWSGGLSGADNPVTTTITGNTVVTATFVHGGYSLVVTVVGQGEVDEEPGHAVYEAGNVVTLTATAEPGWAFMAWSGALSGVENPAMVTITGHTTITATFTTHQLFVPCVIVNR